MRIEVWAPGTLVHLRKPGPGDAGCWRIIRAVVSRRSADRGGEIVVAYDLIEVHAGRLRTLAQGRLRECAGVHLDRLARPAPYRLPASTTLAIARSRRAEL